MSVEVTLMFSTAAARAIREGGDDLVQVVREFGATLEPMHPDSHDVELQCFYTAQVPDDADVENVIDQLRQSEGIEAAYVKPPGEPPS